MNLTLADQAQRVDPDGTAPHIAELLTQSNKILEDMVVKQGNLAVGDRVTIRTGLPTTHKRAYNTGVPTSKSTTVQVDEGISLIEAWSELDQKVASLNGNKQSFRMQEGLAFVESMNQTVATDLFYGNPATNSLEMLGLAPRYADFSAANGQNVLSAGGTNANQQTSIYLVGWGDHTCYTIFPEGSNAGLYHKDWGETVVQVPGGNTSNRMAAFLEQWTWEIGLVVKNWQSCVRICNIDTTEFASMTGGSAVDSKTGFFHQMLRATARIPDSVYSMGKPTFYMNGSAFSILQRWATEKSAAAGALALTPAGEQFGRPQFMLSFMGIPIRRVDAILNTEAVVS